MKAEVASRVKEMMKGDRELAVKRKKKVKELWKESINQTMGGLGGKIETKNIVFEGRQAAVNYKDESEPQNYYQPQDCFNLTVINQPMKTKRDGIKKKGTERG